MGRRGPGSGLREARTASEAAQWCRLFGALASAQAQPVLPHLGLRAGDGPVLRAVSRHVHTSLRSILAATRGATDLTPINTVLAKGYAELERQHGARLARGVFALGSDGFPGPDAAGLMVAWDSGLRALAGGDGGGGAIPAAKRDIVVALVGHHLAAVEPLDTLAAEQAAGGPKAGAELDWLVALARWRRHATVLRALARVLTPSERQRLAGLPQADPWPEPVPEALLRAGEA